MYVCICHAVTEDDVRRHADAGVCSAKELRAACGMRPGCGQCVLRMHALLGAERVDGRTAVGVSEAWVA
ncbi:MAG TPA: (2Fe-2S)-binding protein [Streptosporangiaceae bacterium]|jgi:bacterioferritin-associated ferredoxin